MKVRGKRVGNPRRASDHESYSDSGRPSSECASILLNCCGSWLADQKKLRDEEQSDAATTGECENFKKFKLLVIGQMKMRCNLSSIHISSVYRSDLRSRFVNGPRQISDTAVAGECGGLDFFCNKFKITLNQNWTNMRKKCAWNVFHSVLVLLR